MTNKSFKRFRPLICVIGKSGVGKTSIVRESGLDEVVSYTDRPKREGEIIGVDYRFRTKKELELMKAMGVFELDYVEVFGDIKCALDVDLLTKDIFVVHWKNAVHLREQGLPVYIVEIKGDVRVAREGRTDDEIPSAIVDARITNEGTLEDAGKLLRILHETLDEND